jgi:hypothetical protein
MAWMAIHFSKTNTLEFRGCELGAPHTAPVHLSGCEVAHLEGIHVHQAHQGSLMHQDVGFVHVPDNISGVVKGVEGRCEVVSCANKVEAVEKGMVAPPGLWTTKIPDGTVVQHAWHEEPDGSTSLLKQIHWPSQAIDAVGRVSQQQGQLGCPFIFLR